MPLQSTVRRTPGNPAIETIRLSTRYASLSFVGLMIHGVLEGLVEPLSVYAQRGIYDGGLAVLRGEFTFARFSPWIVLLAASLLYPAILSAVKWSVLAPNYWLRIVLGMRRFLSERCLRMKYECFEDPQKVDSMDQVYQRSGQEMHHMAVMYVPGTLASLIRIVGLSTFLVQVRWWLPFTVVAPYALTEFMRSVYFVKVYDVMWKNFRKQRLAQALATYMQTREYVKELKLFRAFEWLNGRYVDRIHRYNKTYERHYVRNMGLASLMYLVDDLCRAANVVVVLAVFLRGEISVGLFIALGSQIFGLHILFGIAGYRLSKYIFEKYYDVLGYPDEASGTIDEVSAEPEIEFENVRFRYPGSEVYVVDGVSFRVPARQRLSLVGENGAGKSTLIKLLLGLYEPESGRILVGGHEVGSYTREARSRIFAAVFQDFVHYSLTLRENLALGTPELLDDDHALMDAASRGGFASAAERLGLDQLLGKEFSGGTDLSGGEWQRLVLSRAFVGGRSILLLDEPTSQLDPMAEADLYRRFANASEDRTALLVTHRLGSTKITDRILVMHAGKIEEEGTHEELMDRGGIYATMFASQRQWYEPAGGSS